MMENRSGGYPAIGGKMTIMRKILIVAILLALFGCAAPTPEEREAEAAKTGWVMVTQAQGLAFVYRIVDEEAGVVCWVFTGPNKGGISCLPLGETGLDR